MEKEWKFVPGYGEKYLVSNHGDVHGLICKGKKRDTPHIFKPRVDIGTRDKKPIRCSVKLVDKNGNVKTWFVHTLVLMTFVGPKPDGMVAAHNNGNGIDNRVENLRWTYQKYNLGDMVSHGTVMFGEKNPAAKLTKEDVIAIRRLIERGVTQDSLVNIFGVRQSVISSIVLRKTWAHIP